VFTSAFLKHRSKSHFYRELTIENNNFSALQLNWTHHSQGVFAKNERGYRLTFLLLSELSVYKEKMVKHILYLRAQDLY